MTIDLDSYINSDWQLNANAITAQNKVLVYVEDVSDKPFWFDILQPYQTRLGVIFEIQCYSNNSLATGSEHLKNVVNTAGQYLLICKDSDYNYLLQKHAPNPYVFQTYAYAVENLRCYAPSLHQICVQATYNEELIIDFVQLIQDYSELIYDLLIWNLYFYQQGDTSSFSITEFCQIVRVENNGQVTLDKLAIGVNQKIQQLQQAHANITTNDLDVFAKQFEGLGLERNNAYLFMQGHVLEDGVVGLFLKEACNQLKAKHFNTIEDHGKGADQKQINQQRQRYQNLVSELEGKVMTLLCSNTQFKDCFLFHKIKADLDAYAANFLTA